MDVFRLHISVFNRKFKINWIFGDAGENNTKMENIKLCSYEIMIKDNKKNEIAKLKAHVK